MNSWTSGRFTLLAPVSRRPVGEKNLVGPGKKSLSAVGWTTCETHQTRWVRGKQAKYICLLTWLCWHRWVYNENSVTSWTANTLNRLWSSVCCTPFLFSTLRRLICVLFFIANPFVICVGFNHAAGAASKAPQVRRPASNKRMQRVRRELTDDGGIGFETPFQPEQQEIMNFLQVHSVFIDDGPLKPCQVIQVASGRWWSGLARRL